jgi:hypothetical protein
MKTFRVAAVALLLAALLGGGVIYVYRGFTRPARPDMSEFPVQQEPEPVEEVLPAPELAEAAPVPAGDQVARLIQTERTVKTKRASELLWDNARADMELFENDAVRTFDKASAAIAFGPGDVVEVDQNALVIIKRREKETNEISLALLSGELMDSLAAKPAEEQAKFLENESAKRQVTIGRAPGVPASTKTRVAVRTLPDRSTTVAAVSGSINLTTPGKAAVTLNEKMITKISPEGIVLKPRTLPAVPALVFPEDGATYSFQRKVPRVEMKWNAVPGARRYRVVVATDPSFRKIFADERIDTTALPIRNLQPGTYYWRVRAQDGDGFEGPYSAVRSVRATYDDAPPPLAILSPPEMFVSPRPEVEVKGKTDREVRIKINGQKVGVKPDGTFAMTISLKEGVNLVTVEAIDPAGNSEYGKRLITYKGSKRSNAAAVSGNR